LLSNLRPKGKDLLGGDTPIPLTPGEPRHLRVTLDTHIDFAEVRDVTGGTTPLSWVVDFPEVPVHLVDTPGVTTTLHPSSARACKAIGGG
jgi:hypothetical protein